MSDIPGRSKNNAPTTEKQQKRAHHAESKGLNGASQAQGGGRERRLHKALPLPRMLFPRGLYSSEYSLLNPITLVLRVAMRATKRGMLSRVLLLKLRRSALLPASQPN